jgi:Flp pilus assembly pilin Flp
MFLHVYSGVSAWWNDLRTRADSEGGATAVEYALMLALVALVIVTAVAYLGHAASNQFHSIGSGVENA